MSYVTIQPAPCVANFEASPKLHNPLERGAGWGTPQQYRAVSSDGSLARTHLSLPHTAYQDTGRENLGWFRRTPFIAAPQSVT